MRSGLRSFLSQGSSFLAPLLAAALAGCSLSLENPEDEARKKLATLVPPTWELLEGRWVGDSTYTIFDTKASPLEASLVVDIFPDSTVTIHDHENTVFPGILSYRGSLSGDTLALTPTPGKGEPDTVGVKLRFLANWMELTRESDHRFVHFHKVKSPDSAVREALLDSGVWVRRQQRHSMDSIRTEVLRKDFDYLRFPGDSLVQDTRRNGLSTVLAGPLRPAGRRWAWSPGGAGRTLHVDLFDTDSLRVWPMPGGLADSGYSLYVREKGIHALDLDMTPYAGHLRADTVVDGPISYENHYGRYYDLVLGQDHGVTTLTNIAGMPSFRAWSIDSGALYLEVEGGLRTRFRVDRPSSSAIRLTSSPGGSFPRNTALHFTALDGSAFAGQPLRRFDNASYLRLEIRADSSAPDTLDYFFNAASRKASPEEHELARISAGDTTWAAWRIDPALDPYGSSQSGFLFAFAGRTAGLGRFTCRSVASADLAIRIRASDATWFDGLVQGRCRITAAEKAPTDSLMTVSGEFKSRRRNVQALLAPFWKQP